MIELEAQTKEHLPFRLWPKDVEVTFLPPALIVKDIDVLPNEKNLSHVLAPGHIDRIEVELNWLAFLRGQARIAQIKVLRPTFKVVYKGPGSAPLKKSNQDLFNFDQLQAKLPIDVLKIEQLDLMAELTEHNIAAHVVGLNMEISNRYRSFYVDLEIPQIVLKEKAATDALGMSLASRFLIEPEEINITALKIKKQDSYVVAAGEIVGDWSRLKWNTAKIDARWHLKLPETISWINTLQPELKLPKFEGVANADVNFKFDKSKAKPEAKITLQANDLKVDKFVVGKVDLKALWDPDKISAESLKIENSSGLVTADAFSLSLSDLTFRTQVLIHKLELSKLLENLNVHGVPLRLDFLGSLACSGQIRPMIQGHCGGKLAGKDLWVYSHDDKKTIVRVPQFAAVGGMNFDLNSVNYVADLTVGKNSVGASDGVVIYDQGFKINYEAKKLDFADVADLAGLNLEGEASLKGSTQGDSHWATLRMDLKARNFWLSHYFLGDAAAKANYKSGILSFNDLDGRMENSNYLGEVAIDLPKNNIYLNMNLPRVDLEDVQTAFSRHVTLPFAVTGAGSARVKATGPLALSAMTYDLKSNFSRTGIGDENFDDFRFHVSAVNGQLKSHDISLTKGSGHITMDATVTPEAEIDAVIVGRALRLEQSETLEGFGLNVLGQLDTTTTLKGTLPRPRIDMHGRLSKLVVGDIATQESSFHFKMDDRTFEGGANFAGEAASVRFVWPLTPDAPFSLSGQTNRWNFVSLFSLFSGFKTQDFDTRLSADVNLSSPRGGIWNSSGSVRIQDFEIRRGSLSLNAPRPILIDAKKGVFNTNNFYLLGENSHLKLNLENSTHENLNMSLNSSLDLSLASILTPFLDDLKGTLTLAMSAFGSMDRPDLQGTANLEKGFVKLKTFPHPFEDMKIAAIFNQNSISLTSINGRMAGGEMSGDGRIQFLGPQNNPIKIRGQLTQASFNFPDNFRTKGSADIELSGSSFPYLLSGDYNILSGEITSEFDASSATGKSAVVHPSHYLPKFLKNSSFEPIAFDLGLILRNPLRIKNSLVDGEIAGKVRLKGTPDRLALDGSLNMLKGTKVLFRGNLFDVAIGNIDYQNDPAANPRLYLTAQARVQENNQTNNPQIYDINLIAQGKVQELKPAFSSQPTLTEQQIVSLLALGTTQLNQIGSQVNQKGFDPTVANPNVSSASIAAPLLQQPLGKEIKNRLGLDLSVSSDTSQTDNSTVPKVTLSKQWTPKLSVAAGRTLEKNPKSDAKLRYSVDRNMSVVGSWEGQSESGATQLQDQKDTTQSVLGLDLEFKIDFK